MKLRSFFLILCAGAVIALGAMLPGLVGKRLDAAEQGKIQFAPVQEVRLEFADSGITMKQTLAIMGPLRDPVVIPEELATLKRSKVEHIAAETVERYDQEGILLAKPADLALLSDYTVLIYGPENLSNVFWIVDYGSRSADCNFHMVIDDRTGTVCSMECRNTAMEYPHPPEEVDLAPEYAPEEMNKALEGFCRVFLEGLGEEFFEYRAEDLAGKAEAASDRSYVAAQLQFDAWDSSLNGKTRIIFFLDRNGFYTYFG